MSSIRRSHHGAGRTRLLGAELQPDHSIGDNEYNLDVLDAALAELRIDEVKTHLLSRKVSFREENPVRLSRKSMVCCCGIGGPTVT